MRIKKRTSHQCQRSEAAEGAKYQMTEWIQAIRQRMLEMLVTVTDCYALLYLENDVIFVCISKECYLAHSCMSLRSILVW